MFIVKIYTEGINHSIWIATQILHIFMSSSESCILEGLKI